MSGVKWSAVDDKRCTAVIKPACDIGSHGDQRCHDAFHWAGTDRIISVQLGGESLSGKDSGDQSGRSSAVADVKDFSRGCEAVKPSAVYKNLIFIAVYLDSHFAETGDCRKTVSALKKMRDSGCASGK